MLSMGGPTEALSTTTLKQPGRTGLWGSVDRRDLCKFFEESGEGFGRKGEQVPQAWIVGDVDHCVAELKHFIRTFGITDIVSMAVPPGLRAGDMSDSLERLFTEVVPRVKLELQSDA